MASEAQIRANRLNAQKSTGPRSKRGKDVVSQNAVKHGLCANKHVIRNESVDEFNLFRQNMIADFMPVGAMELVLVDRIVSLSWRLKRAEYFQNAVIEALIEHDLCGYLVGWEDSVIRKAKDQMEVGDADLILGIAVNRDFAKSRTLDLLLSYERRIESSLYKATAELRKLKKMRLEKQSEIEEEHRTQNIEEYRKQNTENRIELDMVEEETEQVSAEAERVMAETEFAKQSQSAAAEDYGEREKTSPEFTI